MIDNLPTHAEISAVKPLEIQKPPELKIVEPTKIDEIIKTNEAGGEVVKVPSSQLPVGEGEEKVSRLAARMEGVMGKASQEEIDKLGLQTSKSMNNKANIKAAAEFVIKNPDDAMRVLKGEIDPPQGVLKNSVYVAMTQQATEDGTGRLTRDLAGLTSKRFGQEIEILKEIDKNNPVKIVDDLKKYNIETLVGKKDTDIKFNQKINKEKSTLVSLTKSETIKGSKAWSDILEQVRC